MKIKLTTALIACSLLALVACKEKGPAEKAGERIDNAANKLENAKSAEDVGEAVDKLVKPEPTNPLEKLGDKIDNAAEEAKDNINDAADKAEDKLKNAVEETKETLNGDN